MLASSQLDLVIGLDIHMEMVPTPAPTPTPFPMPFLGMIEFTPGGALISMGIGKAVSCVTGAPPTGPVLINGFPATKTGDEAQNKKLLPHFVIPPGVSWTPLPKPLKPKAKPGPPPPPDSPAKPPGDAVMVTGSATVYTEGSNQCRLGDLAMSCSDPVRLPSSILLPIPKGAPVLVGGAPKFDWSTTAKAFLLRNKWTAGLLHSLISRLPPGRLRNLLGKVSCFLTGHPVDVATGRLLTDANYFELRGPIPLTFECNYASSWANRDSTVGHGWSHSFDERVWLERGKVIYKAGDGREVEFHCFHLPGRYMREGQELFYPIDRLTLKCFGNGYWSIRTPDGLVREFEPVEGVGGHVSMLRRITDRAGHWVQFDYERGLLDAVTTSEGRWMRFEHRAGLLQRVAVQVGDGPADGWYDQVRFAYSPERDLIAATDTSNRSRTYRYDAHLLIEEKDRDGVAFFFEYDGRDHTAYCVRTWGTDGKTTDRLFFREIIYDKKNGRTFVEDSLGHTTVYVMNPANAVVEVIDPHGAKTTYEYNEHLWRTAEIDALGNATRFVFDGRGNESERTFANGARVVIEYNRDDQPARMVDPLGVEWTWQYDHWGRLIGRRNSLGEGFALAYEGRVVQSMTRADGLRYTFDYDIAENVTRVTLPDGSAQERWHDRQGRLIKVRDAVGHAQRFEYDWESRLVYVNETGNLWRRIAFSAEGDVIGVQDGQRHVMYGYSGYHRLAWRMEASESIQYRYSTEDDLLEVVNEVGERCSFTRDACGRIIEERGFEGRKHAFEVDTAGRMTKRIRPSKQEEIVAYDVMGNVASIKYPDGSVDTFVYDAIGNLLSATNAIGTVKWERDARGRVLKESFGDDWVSSRYDHLGNRIELESSRGLHQKIGRTALGGVRGVGLFERDTTGVPRAVWGINFQRDAIGRETARSMPGGVVALRGYNDGGLPWIRELLRGQDRVARTEYTWEGAERLRRREDHRLGATDYVHDARGRLSSARFSDGSTQERAPGPSGNLYKRSDRKDRVYGAAGILLEVEGTKFLYNRDGALISKQGAEAREWKYTWNGAEMLAAVERPDGMRLEFSYDALGRRVKKVARGADGRETTTEWRWDRNMPIHEWTTGAEGDDGAAVTWLFEPESFSPMGRLEQRAGQRTKRYAIVADYMGTPEEMLDEAGEVVWKTQLDAFGVPRMVLGDEEQCPWRRPGQYEDEQAGLYYNRFRYYSPERGDYISQDPIRLLGGVAPYAYVPDPYSWIDELGLERGLWQLTKEMSDATRVIGKRVYVRHVSTGLWWSRDTAGHGGSAFKVFTEGSGETLNWYRDADKYGDFIDPEKKHKGEKGKTCK